MWTDIIVVRSKRICKPSGNQKKKEKKKERRYGRTYKYAFMSQDLKIWAYDTEVWQD